MGGESMRCERGSIQPLLAVVLGGAALAMALIMVGTAHRVRVARAQWAADGSARAAAAEMVTGADGGGREAGLAARGVAEANGGSLVAIDLVDGGGVDYPDEIGSPRPLPVSPVVVVEVEVAGVRARAGAGRFAVTDS